MRSNGCQSDSGQTEWFRVQEDAFRVGLGIFGRRSVWQKIREFSMVWLICPISLAPHQVGTLAEHELGRQSNIATGLVTISASMSLSPQPTYSDIHRK